MIIQINQTVNVINRSRVFQQNPHKVIIRYRAVPAKSGYLRFRNHRDKAAVYADLQRATAMLNAETEDQSRDEEDPDSRSEAAENAIDIKLSGNPDLRRLTPAQIDRLEQGFQQAVTDDRRLHRNYVNLEALYAALAK